MAKRLFVGGIPYAATEDQLQEYFAKIGTVVSCNIITDKYTGRSKGFGFIEMSTEEEAKKAMETYDGQDFEGRKITVKEARPMQERSTKPEAGSAPEPKPEVAESAPVEPPAPEPKDVPEAATKEEKATETPEAVKSEE